MVGNKGGHKPMPSTCSHIKDFNLVMKTCGLLIAILVLVIPVGLITPDIRGSMELILGCALELITSVDVMPIRMKTR